MERRIAHLMSPKFPYCIDEDGRRLKDNHQDINKVIAASSLVHHSLSLSILSFRQKMNDLPLDVSFNIFSRLPIDSVLDCKLVCKPWRNLIKNPTFAQTHLARHKLLLQKSDENQIQDLSIDACETVQSGFFLLERIFGSCEGRLHYIEYKVDAKKMSYEIIDKTINIPAIKIGRSKKFWVGSCNGLICSTVCHHGLADPIHIFNPVTREYAYLPRYICEEKFFVYDMISGFGYSPSTGEYKVVRIWKGKEWCFQVYVLGNENNNWTKEKKIPHPFFCNVPRQDGVHLDGEIHWLDSKSNIVSFNLAEEEFHFIASPPFTVGHPYFDRTGLYVVGDRLCLVHHKSATRDRNAHVEMWLLQKNSDMNVVQHNWNKEFILQVDDDKIIHLIPLAFTKKGKVLFWQDEDYKLVYYYDPETAKLDKLSEDENYGQADVKSYPAPAAHHINSFVSLRALGVKNCRRRLQYKGVY